MTSEKRKFWLGLYGREIELFSGGETRRGPVDLVQVFKGEILLGFEPSDNSGRRKLEFPIPSLLDNGLGQPTFAIPGQGLVTIL